MQSETTKAADQVEVMKATAEVESMKDLDTADASKVLDEIETPEATDRAEGTTATDEVESEKSEPHHTEVMRSIRLENVPRFAIAARKKQRLASFDGSCIVHQPPLYGSYHVVYIVEFSDGIRWVLKVPGDGLPGRWDDDDARTLKSEALTMRMISRQTTAPVPRVHDFDSSVENELNCPFILMDHISGVHGPEAWFNGKIDPALLEERRTKTLHDVAKAMSQLGQFVFSHSGIIEYDENGDPSGTLSSKARDTQTMLEQQGQDDALPVFFDIHPCATAEEFMLRELNCRAPPRHDFCRGIDKLLRLFISWTCEDQPTSEFALAHPDFDIQNIIVSEDGGLVGLIDWDGVEACPKIQGNEILPGWLTRDWDPLAYLEGSPRENTIEELDRYRAVYAKYMQSTLEPSKRSGVTGRSLLVGNLRIAAGDLRYTIQIVDSIFDEVKRFIVVPRKAAKSGGLVAGGQIAEDIVPTSTPESEREAAEYSDDDSDDDSDEDSDGSNDEVAGGQVHEDVVPASATKSEGEEAEDTGEDSDDHSDQDSDEDSNDDSDEESKEDNNAAAAAADEDVEEDEVEEIFIYDLCTQLQDGEFDPRQLAQVKAAFKALCRHLDQMGVMDETQAVDEVSAA